MKSYSTSLALLNSMSRTSTTDTTNNALLTSFLNDSIRAVCNIRGGTMPFMEDTRTIQTVASQQSYYIPASFRKINNLYVTVGTNIYTPTPVDSAERWSEILAGQLGGSDTPAYYFVQGKKVYMAPTPSTTAGVITITGRLSVVDVGVVDYTTGSILTATNGGTTIVGTGTTWNATMIGKYIKISSTGAAKSGDNRWYLISVFTSTTQITLATAYEGTAISAGSTAYIIGEMSPIPEAYDMAPIYRALALYSQVSTPMSPQSYMTWWKLYDGGQEAGLRDTPGGLIGQMLENEGASIEGPYVSPKGITNLDPNDPPRYPLTGMQI